MGAEQTLPLGETTDHAYTVGSGSQADRSVRLAMAGAYMLKGMRFTRALQLAGYSESYARSARRHGLTAEAALELAMKGREDTDPREIRSVARALFLATLRAALSKPGKTTIVAAGRAAEIAERIAQGVQDQASQARAFVDRLEWLAAVQGELRRRGLAGGSAPDATPQHVVLSPDVRQLDAVSIIDATS